MQFKLQRKFLLTKYLLILLLVAPIFLLCTRSVKAEYKIGVDYHATGSNFNTTTFMSQYHDPMVRQTVLTQLKGMADSGVDIIHTRLWMVENPDIRDPVEKWRLAFPYSSQELDNIATYTYDVAHIKNSKGKYLELYLTTLSLWCASPYDNRRPTTGCQEKNIDEVIITWKNALDSLFNKIGNITNGDGKKAVSTLYLQGELRPFEIGSSPDKYYSAVWPYFVNLANRFGITPSMYSVVDRGNYYITQGQTNPDSHLKNIDFMMNYLKSKGLPQPNKIDFSGYIDPVDGNYDGTINHILDDLFANYPGKQFGVAETYYPLDPVIRKKYAQSWADAYNRRGQPVEVLFWTTPNGGATGEDVGYPFDINSFLPQVLLNSSFLNTSFTPWVTSLKGFNLNSNLYSRFYDTNQTRWGKDNPIALATDKTWVSARFPGNIPPSNCNIGKTCTIYVSLFDPEKNTESNKIGVAIPATKQGDFNFDGKVDLNDFNLLKTDFTKYYSIFDYNLFVQNFGK